MMTPVKNDASASMRRVKHVCTGTTGAVTRYVAGTIDPVTIAAFRFGIGIAVLFHRAHVAQALPPGILDRHRAARRDVLCVFLLLQHRDGYSRARAAHALDFAALDHWWRRAGPSPDRTQDAHGVLIAVGGVAVALAAVASSRRCAGGAISSWSAPRSAYVLPIWSRPFIARSRAWIVTASMTQAQPPRCRRLARRALVTASFDAAQWIAVLYLGVFGGALAFSLIGAADTGDTDPRQHMTVNRSRPRCGRRHRDRADRLEPDCRPDRGRGRDLDRLDVGDKKRAGPSPLILILRVKSLDLLLVLVEAAAGARAADSLPPKTWTARQSCGSSTVVLCLARRHPNRCRFACHHETKRNIRAQWELRRVERN